MDIQSTSHSKHSPSSTHKEGHGKDVPKERIQSVEPELESLGAVGGEGISYFPETERSTITVSPTIPDTFSAQKKNHGLFYKTYPISPVTKFTDKYLEEVSGKAVTLAKHLHKKIEKIFV